jgi:hypothetical protein
MSRLGEVVVSDPSVATTPLAYSEPAIPGKLVTNSWEMFNDRQRWMLIFVLFLVGVTFGPVVTGMLSDHIGHSYGPEQGLRCGASS